MEPQPKLDARAGGSPVDIGVVPSGVGALNGGGGSM